MSAFTFTTSSPLALRPATARRRATRVVAAATPASAPAAATVAGPAFAKSFEEAEAEKMARKEALRAAAQASAATGRSASAFADSEYQLSEESKTPNFHTRQDEGLRKAGGS